MPTRLFPPDRDGATLHVVTPGARVGRSGETLVVTPPGGEPPTRHAIRESGRPPAPRPGPGHDPGAFPLRRLGDPGPLDLTTSGHHIASLTARPSGQVQRRLRQYRALMADEATCLRLAKALAHAKVEGQHRYLLRGSRGDAASRDSMLSDLVPIRSALTQIGSVADRDSLRGLEGSAAVGLFPWAGQATHPIVPESLRYTTRNRRPPVDRFNALLGFGYGLLHTAVMRAILASGLEPALGFFHTPRSSAYPLVLDLMELFRVPLWDMVLIGSLNRGQWDPGADFAVTKAKVWLSDPGRKKAIGLFESRLDRDLEASGPELLPVLRSRFGIGRPAPREGVERRARIVRENETSLNRGRTDR